MRYLCTRNIYDDAAICSNIIAKKIKDKTIILNNKINKSCLPVSKVAIS